MGSVCVAFGAILGKVSPVQLLIMTLFQVTLFSVNEFILLSLLNVSRGRSGGEGGGDTWGDRRGLGRHARWIPFDLGTSLNPLNSVSKVGAVTLIGHAYSLGSGTPTFLPSPVH